MEAERLQSLCPSKPCLGYHVETVVGIRHGDPEGVSNGTVLALVREPTNPYDSNAVRVERGAKKVGYIRAPFAKRLSPVLDGGAGDVEVHCMALDTPDRYDLTVALVYYGKDDESALPGLVGAGRWISQTWVA